MSYLLFVFFFSSRRRHTRCSRDWSSDVCSSDLPRSCATTFRSWSEAASRLDLHARPHAHVDVLVVVVDLPQCPRRRVTNRPHLVALRRRQSIDRARACDFSQRPGGGCADILVAVLQRSDERLHRPIVLDFAEGPDCRLPPAGYGIAHQCFEGGVPWAFSISPNAHAAC